MLAKQALSVNKEELGPREMVDAEKKHLFESLLPALNTKLKEAGKFFCGELTVADLTYYFEISTILLLSVKEIKQNEMPNLHEWFYTSMRKETPCLKDLDQLFLESMASNKQ